MLPCVGPLTPSSECQLLLILWGKGDMKNSQYFHLNDNVKAAAKGDKNYDPLFKVKPLLEVVQENSRLYYHPGGDISVDEAMIKFNAASNSI